MPEKPDENPVSNVVSMIDRELTEGIESDDLELLQELAAESEMDIEEVLRSEKVRHQLDYINQRRDKTLQRIFLGKDKADERKRAVTQKRFNLWAIISGMKKLKEKEVKAANANEQ